MKTLEIIIPHYKETEDIIYKNLRMLSLQENIDFKTVEVLIVNDGPNAYVFSEEFINKFKPLNIRQITSPTNGGPGMARQYGIDNSDSKWIMFIDADDCLLTIDALFQYIYYIKQNPDADIIRSEFKYSQYTPDKGILIVRQDISMNTWLHGKLYRRNFLIKKNIRFFDGIRCSEDVAWNMRSKVKGRKDILIPNDLYLYRNFNNANSITSSIDHDTINYTHICAIRTAIKYMVEHKDSYERPEYVFYTQLNYCWYLLKAYDWKHADIKEKFEQEFFNYYVENFNLYSTIKKDELNVWYYLQTKDYLKRPFHPTVEGLEYLEKSSYQTLEEYVINKLKKH